MADIPGMDIPDAVRQMAERNVDQARNAYAQLMEMARKAQETLAKSSGAMTEAALEAQAKAMRFTEQNIEANFKLMSDLARARDMKEYFEIQGRHAQTQMQTYATQARELGQLLAEVAQKSQPKP
ncbi:MAG: phasin family protein [Hyphomicrobiaceae bacterium]